MPRMLSKFMTKWRALKPEERHFAALAWVAAPLVELSLWTIGMKHTVGLVERCTGSGADEAARVTDVGRARALVDGVYRRHLVRGECLPRSIVQYGLQRRAGLQVRLVVGVRRLDGFQAHAWVEGADEPAPSDASYSPLYVTGSA